MLGVNIGSIFFFGVILFIAVIMLLGQYFTAQRRKELAAWAASAGLDFSSEKRTDLAGRFGRFEVLSKGFGQYAYNIMEGRFGNRGVICFDYCYKTRGSKGETESNYLSAVIVQSAVPLKPLNIRPEGLLDKIGEIIGFENIKFESAEFSRRFHVAAADRKWAYDVIHARAMELLLGHPEQTIQFARDAIMVRKGESKLSPEQFTAALQTATKLLDMLPQYVIQEQTQRNDG